MKKNKRLPDVIYVSREEEGTENEFLQAVEKEYDLAETRKKNIGVYKLVQINELELQAVSKPVR